MLFYFKIIHMLSKLYLFSQESVPVSMTFVFHLLKANRYYRTESHRPALILCSDLLEALEKFVRLNGFLIVSCVFTVFKH